MKKLVPAILLFLAPFAHLFAETFQTEINWLFPKKITTINGNSTFALYFSDANFLPENHYLPTKLIRMEGNVTFIKVVSFTSEALNPVEANLVNNSFLAKSIELQTNVQTSSGVNTSFITFTPLFYNENMNVAEKITSITFEYISNTNPVISTNSLTIPTAGNTKNARSFSTSGSVLAAGDWYKMTILEEGVYKISYDDLKKMGVNPDNIDPRKIRICGNEGGNIPQPNATSRPYDVVENNIQVIGESDGVFNKEDYIVFYAEGPNKVKLDNTTNSFYQEMNLYSSENYYFLNVGSENGKRISTATSPSSTDINFSYYDAFNNHEIENSTFLSTGRLWLGENITKSAATFSIPNISIEPSSIIKIGTSTVSSSVKISTSIYFQINGSTIGESFFQNVSPESYGTKAIQKIEQFNLSSDSYNNSTWNFTANYTANGDKEALGYVDYFNFNYRNKITSRGYTPMYCIDCKDYNTAGFNFDQNYSGYNFWDVTDLYNTKSVAISNSVAKFETNSSIKKFVLFTASDLRTPTSVVKINNQNIKAETQAPDLLIVTHPDFLDKAKELADFKRTTSGLNVVTVTTTEIYNEFSSGRQDISAIRDYVRFLYQKNTTSHTLKFLLLIGDCSYDYKNITKGNTNFIPVYQSRESLHNVNSYSSDDYFTFMDDNEGIWNEDATGNHGLDLSVGRLPVQTNDQLEIVIKKIKNYAQNPDVLGKWRNNVIMVADDEDNNLHVDDADKLSKIIGQKAPSSNIKKIFLDSYTSINSAGGRISPATTEAVLENIDNGALIVNYTGHGSERQWAKEKIITIDDIQKMRNYDRLPFFMTATCEFGRYDDPNLTSGGETLVLAPNGGAIGALTTTRPVYASSNFAINVAFYNNVFIPKTDGTRPAIGEIMQKTKNESHIGVNNRNFSLLGDPSLLLTFPYYQLEIDSIGDKISSSGNPDTLKALGEINMKGRVLDLLGNQLSDFNGQISISVYDKFSDKKTLGQGINSIYNYKVQENKLFEGKASVKNGRFSFAFVVPKDISYNYDLGKISLYASQLNSQKDAGGYNTNIIIGGTNKNAPSDETPPTVSLFMNDSSFVEGGLVNPNAKFKAFVNDENGINTASSGIGHEMTATLDNTTPIVLNNFYESDENTYKSGRVFYDYKNLTPGEHFIKFKVWDTHNNSTEKNVRFTVEGLKLTVSPYPNPFQDEINFAFEQNRFNKNIIARVTIYNIQGEYINTIEKEIKGSDYIVDQLNWDGRAENGNFVNSGMYMYKLDVIYQEDLIQLSKTGKIIYTQ